MTLQRPTGTRAKRLGAAAAFVLLALLGAPGTTVPVQAQAGWPFQLEWAHSGAGISYFQLCVNGQCAMLDVYPKANGLWGARLPVLPPGEHRLSVEACGFSECFAGTPDLMIRVVAPNGRRPPIDVISGPRIGVGDR